MVKGFSKTELMKQIVDTAAFDKASMDWRHEVFCDYPTYRMFAAGVVAMPLLGYGYGYWLETIFGTVSMGLGLVIALLMVRAHRNRVLNGVRDALENWLEADMPEMYWWQFPSVDMIPGHMVNQKESAVEEHADLKQTIRSMLDGLWGNLLFFVPDRVDAYVMRFMLSGDVRDLRRRIASHLRDGESLRNYVNELEENNRKVVRMQHRGGGTRVTV